MSGQHAQRPRGDPVAGARDNGLGLVVKGSEKFGAWSPRASQGLGLCHMHQDSLEGPDGGVTCSNLHFAEGTPLPH